MRGNRNASRASLNQEIVPLGAEDRFAIIGIRDAPQLAPSHKDGLTLGTLITITRRCFQELTPVFDVRGLANVYNDVSTFMQSVAEPSKYPAHVLINTSDRNTVDRNHLERFGFRVLEIRDTSFSLKGYPLDLVRLPEDTSPTTGSPEDLADSLLDYISEEVIKSLPPEYMTLWQKKFIEGEGLDLDLFAFTYWNNITKWLATISPDYISDLIDNNLSFLLDDNLSFLLDDNWSDDFIRLIPSLIQVLREDIATPENARGSLEELVSMHMRAAILSGFLRRRHRHSLLIEFCMHANHDRITCVPYHSYALHQIEMPYDSSVIIGRPGVVARTTATVLSSDLSSFEALINTPRVRERQIQIFLEQHPEFLKGLNYQNVYPQLILERVNQPNLIPDFILEPHTEEWCDILDLKLPRQKLTVGRRDRATLAAAIHEVAAQLREYAAYFEDPKHRKFVRQKYGLNVYRPRLIAVVGRDMKQMTDPEIRRVMTSYEGLEFLTFDQLIKHAKTRMLI